MNKPVYKLILFDLDDTLIDYQRTEEEALNYIYKKYYKTYIDNDSFVNDFKYYNIKLWAQYRNSQIELNFLRRERFRIITEKYNADISFSSVVESYEKKLSEKVYVFSDTRRALHRLTKDYDLGLVTNGIASIQRKKLKKLELRKYFKKIIISGDVGLKKPSPEFFDHALHLFKQPPKSTLMIGDSLDSDLIGAKSARIDFCWLNRENRNLPVKYPKPQFIIESLEKLKDIL